MVGKSDILLICFYITSQFVIIFRGLNLPTSKAEVGKRIQSYFYTYILKEMYCWNVLFGICIFSFIIMMIWINFVIKLNICVKILHRSS